MTEKTMNSRILFSYALSISCMICGCGTASTTDPGGTGGEPPDGGVGGDSGADADADSEETHSNDPYECIFPNKSVEKATGRTVDCCEYKCSTLTGCKWPPCESDDDCVDSTLELGWEQHFPVVCTDTFYCDPDTPFRPEEP